MEFIFAALSVGAFVQLLVTFVVAYCVYLIVRYLISQMKLAPGGDHCVDSSGFGGVSVLH